MRIRVNKDGTISLSELLEDWETSVEIEASHIRSLSTHEDEIHVKVTAKKCVSDETKCFTKFVEFFFPIIDDIKFGNWGIVGFIFDRLSRSSPNWAIHMHSHSGELPLSEFEEVYSTWMSRDSLI